MKKVILLVFVLAIMMGCIGINACAGEKGLAWNDVLIYPGAELVIERSWSRPVLPEEEPWLEVEWRYYLAGDKYSVSEVTSFYESEMSAQGWQEISGLGWARMEETLWSYCEKINLYVPADIEKRLSSWGYYTKNNEKDWAAIWMGINKEWDEADKTFIVIMRAR